MAFGEKSLPARVIPVGNFFLRSLSPSIRPATENGKLFLESSEASFSVGVGSEWDLATSSNIMFEQLSKFTRREMLEFDWEAISEVVESWIPRIFPQWLIRMSEAPDVKSSPKTDHKSHLFRKKWLRSNGSFPRSWLRGDNLIRNFSQIGFAANWMF